MNKGSVIVDSEEKGSKFVSAILKSLSIYLAAATAAVALLSYGAITVFYSGYLKYFGVDIFDVNFFPSVADFVSRGFPTVSAFTVIVLATLLGVLLANLLIKGLGAIGRRSEQGKRWFVWLKIFEDEPVIGGAALKIFLFVVFLIFSFKLVYFDSEKMGYEAASTTSSFSSFIDDDGVSNILIYQNAGEGVFKGYDSNEGLSNSYKVLPLAGKEYEKINIK